LTGLIWRRKSELSTDIITILRSKSTAELHPNAMDEQMTENKKPLKPDAEDQSHLPAKHIEEAARLASSVETAKDPGKVRRTNE
jgi:hypothetical protein